MSLPHKNFFNEGRMKQFINGVLKKVPVVNTIAGYVYQYLLKLKFQNSENYWNGRYSKGGNSGAGSYSKFAYFKAEVINNFCNISNVNTVIEFGSGDGNQLRLAKYTDQYVGFDVSKVAIDKCREIFKNDATKSFKLASDYSGEQAELTLSLDVIYHLTENEVFELYMNRLFNASTRYVIIYSSNTNQQEKIQPPHVRHRKFTDYIETNLNGWKLLEYIPNKFPYKGDGNKGSFADFYIYEKA
jgi:hypothetical protein